MPIPTVYTELQLAEYMHQVLGDDEVARDLGWSVVEGDYDEAVEETMLALGVDDLAGVTGLANIRLLRAVARRELWRLVMQRTAHKTDTNTEGGNEAHSQIHTHARAMFQIAAAAVVEIEAVVYEVAARPTPPPSGGALRNVYVPWGSE